MKQQSALFIVLFAAVLWGTTGTMQALAPDSAHPVSIGATRLFVGGLFLLIIVIISKKLNIKNLPKRDTFLAALCMAIYQPLFFSSVELTGVAIGTVVAIGSAPVMTGLVEWLFLKKKPSAVWGISTLLSITGCILLLSNQGAVQTDPLGILFALGAGLSFGCYTIINKTLVLRVSPLPAVSVVFTLSGLMLSPFLVIFDMSWVATVEGIAVALHLGVIATGVAYYLFAVGLSKISSSTAVTLSLAEPLTATILGVTLLGEYLSGMSWLGILTLLTGIGVLILSSRKRAGALE